MDQTRAACHGFAAEYPHLQGAGVHVVALGDAMHDAAHIVLTARKVAYINISILILIQNAWQDISWGSCISVHVYVHAEGYHYTTMEQTCVHMPESSVPKVEEICNCSKL